MIRKSTLLILAFVLVHFASFAQRCGFDKVHQHMLATNPAYSQAQAQFRAQWAAYMDAYDKLPQELKQTLANGIDTVFEIPVVVHVVRSSNSGDDTLGGKFNPSDAMIQNYIDFTNNAWAANYAGYPTTSTGGTRIPIKFVLAKRDSACGSTNGIVRINAGGVGNYATGGVRSLGSTTIGSEDDTIIKNLSRWPPSMYYNIWIVNRIDTVSGYAPGSYTAGYAYLASGTSYKIDGTIILASQVYYNTVSGPGRFVWTFGGPGNITLPHELGHAFNLKHVFDPFPASSGCPATGPCATTGDEVCDTQPIASSAFTCPSAPALTCNSVVNDNVTTHNFMDYSNCQDRFTNGQKLRMLYALKTLTSRSTFLTSLGATPLPSTTLPTTCGITANNPGNTFDLGPRDIVISDNVFSGNADTVMHVTSGGYRTDGPPNKVYIDNTCRHMVTLKAGRSYRISVYVGPSSVTTQSRARVSIDYNNDGAWGVTEQVMTVSVPGAGWKTATFLVPTTGTVNCQPIRMRVVVDPVSNVNICGGLDYGQAEDYSVMIVGSGGSSASGSTVLNNPPIGGNPSCFGTQLTFFSDTSSNLSLTGYKWFVNDVEVPGQTTDTFKTSTLLNNDRVKVRVYFNTPCGIDSATSNVDTVLRAVTVPPVVNIGIKSGTIPGCVDDTVTFRMSSNVNPGGSPAYQWQVMVPPAVVFSNVAGQTDTVFKAYGYPANTQVRLQMTSSAGAPCAIPATVQSASRTLTYTTKAPTVTIALTVGTNPGCAGQNLTFRATPTTGGTSPTYTWRVNGVVQTGVTGNTLTKVFANGDVVNCTLNSSSPCASPSTATSNSVTISHVLITADVTIAQTNPSPDCDGKPHTFDATTANSGTSPLYQWFVNNVPIGTPGGSTFVYNAKKNDVVKCVFIATDPCVANPVDTSNLITVDTKPSDSGWVSFKITKGKNPGCLDSPLSFKASVVRLGNSPNIYWLVNGFPAFGPSDTFTTSSLLNGDVVSVMAIATDGNCYVHDTVYSAPDTMVRSITLDPPIIHLIGNTIFVDRPGTFVWFGPNGQLVGGSNGQYHPTAIGPYFAVADNKGCWSKPSNTLTITLLDVETLELDNLQVYPNPSNGKLTLDWKGKKVNVEINVYNQVGQLMMKDELKDGSLKVLNLASLANGQYFISIKDESGKSGMVKISLSR